MLMRCPDFPADNVRGREPDPTEEDDVRIVTTPSQNNQTSLGGRTNSEIRQLQLQDATVGPLLLAKEADHAEAFPTYHKQPESCVSQASSVVGPVDRNEWPVVENVRRC